MRDYNSRCDKIQDEGWLENGHYIGPIKTLPCYDIDQLTPLLKEYLNHTYIREYVDAIKVFYLDEQEAYTLVCFMGWDENDEDRRMIKIKHL
jgi:hypothetical protein